MEKEMEKATEEIKKYNKMKKEKSLTERVGAAIGRVIFIILTLCLISCAVAASIRFIMWLFYI